MSPDAADNLMLVGIVLFLGSACWRYGIGLVHEAQLIQLRKEVAQMRRDAQVAEHEGDAFEESLQVTRGKVDRLRRDIAVTKRRTAEVSKGRLHVVQQLGRPGDDRRCYVFELFRNADASPSQEARPTFDRRFWQQRNMVEVWAPDASTATRQLAVIFNTASGFRRSALIEERAHAG